MKPSLENLHKYPQWDELIEILKTENSPLEERVAKELIKAKSVLDKDAGQVLPKNEKGDFEIIEKIE